MEQNTTIDRARSGDGDASLSRLRVQVSALRRPIEARRESADIVAAEPQCGARCGHGGLGGIDREFVARGRGASEVPR